MGARALRLLALSLVLSVVMTMAVATAQPDPFATMNALRVTPPAPAPDVVFQTLDGNRTRLAAFQGRPVLLTFFTTW